MFSIGYIHLVVIFVNLTSIVVDDHLQPPGNRSHQALAKSLVLVNLSPCLNNSIFKLLFICDLLMCQCQNSAFDILKSLKVGILFKEKMKVKLAGNLFYIFPLRTV